MCMHIHIYICIYTYVHTLQRVCRRCVRWCKKHTCVTFTPAHALVPKTPVPKVHATLTAKKCTYMYKYTHVHTHTYAHEYTCACMTQSTRWSTDTETHNLCPNMHAHTHTHVFNAHKYIYIHTCIYIHIYMSTHIHTYTHTHIYTHTYNMYTCTHTSTPGTTAWQRPRKELIQTQEALHISFVRRNQSHLAPPMLGPHCTHFLRLQYPSTPHPLFPTCPRTVRRPRTLGGHGSTVPHWSIQQSAPLWRSSAQFHNGPLRSCRKIEGRAAVQQCSSRRARRNLSSRMTKVTVHEKREVNENRPNSPSHNHDSAAPREYPLICTSAGPIHPVHSQPMLLATKAIPEMRLHLCHFCGLLYMT